MNQQPRKAMQRVVRLVARGNVIYKIDEPCPGKPGNIPVISIHQLDDNMRFRVDLAPRKDHLGDIDVEVTVRQFIVVFDVVSIDVEEIDPPMIQPATSFEVVKNNQKGKVQ